MVTASMKIASEYTDEINAHILAYSEDKISGFVREPFREIAKMSGMDEELVITRIRSMLEAGTIRRVRQTLLATSLAQGALVAWKIDAREGHICTRSRACTPKGFGTWLAVGNTRADDKYRDRRAERNRMAGPTGLKARVRGRRNPFQSLGQTRSRMRLAADDIF